MALTTVKLLRASVRTVLLGASLALSAVSASPVFAATRHTLHHAGHAGTALYHHTAYHHLHHRLARAEAGHFTNMGLNYGNDLYVSTRHGHHYLHNEGYTLRYMQRYGHYSHYNMRYISYNQRYVRLGYAHYAHSGLQCVPYAREISHIALSGNAFLWWAEASGRYARGNAPEQGAVLNFRAIGRMPLGHVAVVTAVLDDRTILVTQANWVHGSITNDVTVQDVSPNNDWTQVKVELGDTSASGASYPTYGFIYNRADAGTIIANNGVGTEVAEAPAATQVSDEAPNRNLQ